MNVAIVHYHFNRGGVTQVVTNHLRALSATRDGSTPLRVALLYGGRHEGAAEELLSGFEDLAPARVIVEELNYDLNSPCDPATLQQAMRAALASIDFQPEQTVLHVHNHGLGKNLAVPNVLAELAREGFGLLLHVHDFAEDFRPDNYARTVESAGGDAERVPAILYPQATRIHYAVLNGRDRGVLATAGVLESRLHDLPNPVSAFEGLPNLTETKTRFASTFDFDPKHKLVLYPVRGIRRKNLGEILLWSALTGEQSVFAVTLAPMNPEELPSHEAWKQLADRLELPCLFDVGHSGGFTFLESLAACDQIITTSVAEGFGMVFLEAWLAARPLIGRDLPEITADFVKAGVRFDHLRPRLQVPVDLVGKNALIEKLQVVYSKVLAAYDLTPPSQQTIEQQFARLIVEGSIDFASCPREMQASIVELVATQPDTRQRVLDLNPWILTALTADVETEAETIAHNAAVVRESYSLAECGHRLRRVYGDVLNSPTEAGIHPPPNGEKVLASFLAPERLHCIRLES